MKNKILYFLLFFSNFIFTAKVMNNLILMLQKLKFLKMEIL